MKVAQQFAECISLPDHISVQVRAVSNVVNATLVTIEPHSEDDWEVLELNAELAEASILKQVFLALFLLFSFSFLPFEKSYLLAGEDCQ